MLLKMNTRAYDSVVLPNGVIMPPLVQTTNWQNYEQMSALVTEGLRVGFRAFDTARDYGNEHIVGRVMKECLARAGLKRADVFITTKIGNGQQAMGNIAEQIDTSLRNLQTDYVDLWLMHWPYPGFYIDTWRKMEQVYKSGKVRAIGVSNYHVRHFKELLDAKIEIVPHCVQFEHHPMRAADDIFEFCRAHSIAVQAYSPICRMISKIRNSPVLNSIADRIKKSIPQVIFRWHYQHQSVPVFKTLKPERLKENFNIWDFELMPADMEAIHSLDEDYKYHLESASCPGF